MAQGDKINNNRPSLEESVRFAQVLCLGVGKGDIITGETHA